MWTLVRQPGSAGAPANHRIVLASFRVVLVTIAMMLVSSGLSRADDLACTTPIDLNRFTEGSLPQQIREQQAFSVVPSITLGVTATDNARGAPSNQQADLIGTITPGIVVTARERRACLDLDYSAHILQYVEATDQNRVEHNLFADGSVTAVPELLTFDAKGSISQASFGSVRGTGNTTIIPRNQETQAIAYSAGPSALHQFGNFGNVEARYRFSQTLFNNPSASSVLAPGRVVAAPTNATDHEGLATFTTGPEFSQLATAVLDALDETVDNSQISTTRVSGLIGFGYRLQRHLFLLANVGYENIAFRDLPINLMGPIGGAGLRFEPNANSWITLIYGRRDATSSLQGDVRYVITPAVTLFANYGAELSTAQQRIQKSLQFAARDQFGRSLDVRTGLPLDIVNQNVVFTNDVDRVKSGSIGIVGTFGLDQVSIGGIDQDFKSVTGLAPNERSRTVFVSWARRLSPLTRGDMAISYTTVSLGPQNAVNLSLTLRHLFSATLEGAVNYSLFGQFRPNSAAGSAASSPLGNAITNSLTVRVTKIF